MCGVRGLARLAEDAVATVLPSPICRSVKKDAAVEEACKAEEEARAELQKKAALDVAAESAKWNAAAELLLAQAGIDLAWHDSRGMTALNHAASTRQLPLMEKLVAAGAPLEASEGRPRSEAPLVQAAIYSRLAVMRWLLRIFSRPFWIQSQNNTQYCRLLFYSFKIFASCPTTIAGPRCL